MKPQAPVPDAANLKSRFDGQNRPATSPASREPACFFRSGSGFSLGYSPSNDGDRRFHRLSRDFLIESAREQKREMFVLSLIVVASVWPVVSMIVTVVQLICTPHPNFR